MLQPLSQIPYIGINGGTFDPIHFGHLRPALEVAEHLALQQVQFVPCFNPVHRGQPRVSAEQRCQMIELAIAGQSRFVLNRIEIEQGGPSYMVNTLASLKQQLPDQGLVLMMGTDAFAKFDCWHQYERILELANVAVMHRPGEALPETGCLGRLFHQHWVANLSADAGEIVDVAITQLDLSATALRSYLKHQQPVDYLMPEAVKDYIYQHQLYQ